MADKTQAISGMSTRQKVTAGVMVVVVLIILWQLVALFRSGSTTTTPTTAPANIRTTTGAPTSAQPQMMTPKVVDIMAQKPAMTERESELMKQQQETQAKYLQALNDLQVLKVAKDIANANKDISAARLSTVVSEKKIIDILTPPAPPPTSDVISKLNPIQSQQPIYSDQEVRYTVVSISQLQNKWSAVLGYKGTLYNVHVGDTLTADGSTVVSIYRDAVTISKDGKKTRLTLVPIL